MQDLVGKALVRVWFDERVIGRATFGGGVDIHEIELEAWNICGSASKSFKACIERIG